jgi:hypothetical protein
VLEPFEPLRETLLREGVAPVHVQRYLRELSEHVSDLVGEELEAGRNLKEASAVARARLGRDETLADAMLAQPALRSWTGRAPWATLLVGPILLLMAAWLLPFLSVALMGLHPGLNGRPIPPNWFVPVGETVLDLVQVSAPLLITSGVALLGARQRSRVIWPLLGCLAVAYFGGGLVWGAHWPAAGARPGDMSLSFRWGHSLIMGTLSLAAGTALYCEALGRRLVTA